MAQHPKRIDHIARRIDSGLTHKEAGAEFDMSRQHVGRLLRKRAKQSDQPMTDEEC